MDYQKLILRIKCPEIRECPFREPMSCTKCRGAIGEDSVFAIKELLSRVEELEAKNRILEEARENANEACAKWEGLYYTELEKRRYFVTEYCPHCDTESTLMWSVEQHGYEIYCPVCGKKIMLCSMCGHHNDCDWTEEAGCKMKKEEYRE